MSTIKVIAKTLSYVVRHKWYVMIECFKVGLYWQGIIHDLSKFEPSNFIAYSKYFNDDCGFNFNGNSSQSWEYEKHNKIIKDFNYAWLDHIHKNKHHWQYWILIYDEAPMRPLEMPRKYVLEMLCDWNGASVAQGNGDTWADVRDWFHKKKKHMILNKKTLEFIEEFLKDASLEDN